jgi:hypothetical protein
MWRTAKDDKVQDARGARPRLDMSDLFRGKEHFMTYSGGYGGQPQGQPPQGYGAQTPGYGQQQPASAPAPGKGLPFYLNMGVIALGVISFFLGFAPYLSIDKSGSSSGKGDSSDSINFFQNMGLGVGVIGLALLLAAALIAGFSMLPKQQGNESLVAGLSVTGCLSLLLLLIGLGGGLFANQAVKSGIGLIMVLITSFIQAGLAVVVLLFAADVIKPPQPQPQYAGYYGQPGYPAAGYGQAQPQQPGYGAQPQAQPPSQPPYQPPQQHSQPPQNPW